MKKSFVVASLLSGLLAVAAPAIHAQSASQSATQNDPYAGQSHPPSDDVIETTSIPAPKPPAGQPVAPAASVSLQVDTPSASTPMPAPEQGQPTSVDPAANVQSPQAVDGTDGGLVHVAPSASYPAPALSQRYYNPASDPDGDIVHPRPLQPGELQSGSKIWVHLLDRLSTAASEKGDTFRSTVAMDASLRFPADT